MQNEFDEIRPYGAGEVKQAVESLLADRQFSRLLKGFVPWLPNWMRNGLVRLAFVGVNTPLQFQLRFIKPIIRRLLRKCSNGYTFAYSGIAPGPERYTFISNHRDIVLDSAILDLMLYEHHFPTTCEIAIGDNLLIYPWIKTLVKLNKAFTVKRGLSPRELMESSQRMSRYMHYAIQEKRENIWIAQREGRAKDSSDHTQESLLKMFAMAGEGSVIDRFKELCLVPLSISYEYDPCDYLKAQEFQQKRDNPSFKKSKQDDLDNMKTGIFGKKGRIHYEAMPCINTWLDELSELPKTEIFSEIARRIDQQIHAGYSLFPGNYVAADMLNGTSTYARHYTEKERKVFETYLQSRIDLVEIANKDENFLRERILTMYANPVFNKQNAQR
ncbi:MAG: 1-acyl-sn-glycerol-3-phosphate acyltransferase [Bacteroidaceae bacterium]|nr:1-acyl-sn-glycerol-3-phosphate acyltransferase [Bacteroidaceae bacterium]